MSLEKCNTKTQRYEDTKNEDEISHEIIGASIEVHRTLGGPGLLESIYEAALCHELILRGLLVHRQRPVQVVYKGVAIREPLFIDTGSYIFKVNGYKIRAFDKFWSLLRKRWCFPNHKWHLVDFFVP